MNNFLSIVRTLLSWALYAVLVDMMKFKISYAAFIAIVVSILLNYKLLYKGFILNWVILICLFLVLIMGLIGRDSIITKDPWMMASGILAVIAWGSLLIKKPFSLQYAKNSIASDKWQHPLFVRINQIVTMIWGLIFTIGFSLHLFIFLQPGEHGFIIILIYLLSIVGIVLTISYPKYACNKAMKTIVQR